jgi:acyl-CoA synthetase
VQHTTDDERTSVAEYELPRKSSLKRVPSWATLDDAIRHWATAKPGATAFAEPAGRLTWTAYDGYATLLAAAIVGQGLEPGERIGIWIPDGCAVHVAMTACIRAGVVFVGIGARSGDRELRHLLGKSGATTLLTVPEMAGRDTREIFERTRADLPALVRYLNVYDWMPPPTGVVTHAAAADMLAAAGRRIAGRRTPVDELAMLNSTSGTTGLPKCVAHEERRWLKYHEYAVDAGALTTDEICMSVVPAPFGFGLWTAHFTPTLLGAPTVVVPRFDPTATLEMLEWERVSVFMAVSTQFVMLLGHPEFERFDLSRLRVMYTGGEAVPYHKAEEFERRTGAVIVNMYGSNETGVQSYTTVDDPRERRLTTGGRVIPETQVRLFAEDGSELPFGGPPGRPGSIGIVRSRGYYDDPAANDELFTPDGWMLMGDLVTIDEERYLTVVGRTSDFIIRGGKNISAPAVEDEVSSMPALVRCAAVAMPDEVFGERVCIYVVPKPGFEITLDEVREHLSARGVSKEWFPEYLVVVDQLPVAPGGKLAKSVLREDIRRRMAELGVRGRD